MLSKLVEVHDRSEDKNDSKDSQMRISKRAEGIILELNAMHGKAKEKILELIEILRSDGVKDHQIKKILFERITFISKSEIYRVLPQEFKKEYTAKPLPKMINISTPHKVIEQQQQPPPDAEEYIGSPEQEIKKIGEIRRAEEKRDEDEDAQTLEIQFLKERVAELEDALKKSEQFKPASALEQLPKVIESADAKDKEVHSWLKNSADGIGSFYYDTYGIDLFKNRELAQLKNSGVKVFKRLYFEV